MLSPIMSSNIDAHLLVDPPLARGLWRPQRLLSMLAMLMCAHHIRLHITWGLP